MSKMSDLFEDIRDAYFHGVPADAAALTLKVPKEIVREAYMEYGAEWDMEMDAEYEDPLEML